MDVLTYEICFLIGAIVALVQLYKDFERKSADERDIKKQAQGIKMGFKSLFQDEEFKKILSNGGQIKIDGDNNIVISGSQNQVSKE